MGLPRNWPAPSADSSLQAKLTADGKPIAALILETEKCQDHAACDQVSGRRGARRRQRYDVRIYANSHWNRRKYVRLTPELRGRPRGALRDARYHRVPLE